MSLPPPSTGPARADVAVTDAALRLRRVERGLEALAEHSVGLGGAPSDRHLEIEELADSLAPVSRSGARVADDVATRALELAARLEDDPWARLLAAAAFELRARALLDLDRVDDAGPAAADAEDIVAAGLPEGRASRVVAVRVHCCVAAVAAELEEFETAIAHLTTALELDLAHGLGLGGPIHTSIARLLHSVGEGALGLPYLDRALEACGHDEAPMAEILELRAELLTDIGDAPGALRCATEAAEHAERAGLPAHAFRRRIAVVRVALGDHLALTDLAGLRAKELRAGVVSVDTAVALARALVATGRPDEAVAVLEPFRSTDALAPARRDDIADVVVEASRRTGDLDTAVAVLPSQRDRRREHSRQSATSRVLDVSRHLDVALLEDDLAVARAREADLRRLVRQRTEELTWRARHDQLTGLLNREAVAQVVATPPEAGVWRTVAFADVDRFKVVNDAHGHAVGDTVLVALAARLAGAVSVLQGSARLARASADQFVVVVDTPGPLAPDDLARVVRDALAARVEVAGLGELRMSVSLGIAQQRPAPPAPGSDTGADRSGAEAVTEPSLPTPGTEHTSEGDPAEPDLLRDAEVALHRAKTEGGGSTCVFGEGDLRAVVHRFEVERRVRAALAEDRVTAAYDPIVELSTGHVVGVEALARIDAGVRLVAAGEFIDIAEESGLVDEIGAAVSTAGLAGLAASARPWFVAINLGAGELRSPDLVDTLARRVEAAGLTLDRLVVEVTERSFVDVASTEAHALLELARRGVGLAIDDFSTGHSSMVHMSWMPLSLLKIDRSLVIRAAYSASDRILVSAVVSMAGALGLRVVAEGVESPELFAIVRELGCDYAQGHLFGEHRRVGDIPDAFDVSAPSPAPAPVSEDERPVEHDPARARRGADHADGVVAVTTLPERLAE